MEVNFKPAARADTEQVIGFMRAQMPTANEMKNN